MNTVERITIADLTFFTRDRTLRGSSQWITLRPKVAELLVQLIERHPKVVSKRILLEEIWPDTHVEPRALAQLVVELRNALTEAGGSRTWIENVPKAGYRLGIAPTSYSTDLRARPIPTGNHSAGAASAEHSSDSSSPLSSSHRLSSAVLVGSLVLFLLTLAFKYYPPKKSDLDGSPEEIRLAILPVEGLSEPYSWLAYAYPDALTGNLDLFPDLKATPFGDVFKVLKSHNLRKGSLTSPQDSQLGLALGVNTLVQIEVEEKNERLQVSVTLFQKDWSEGFSFATSEPSTTVGPVAHRIAELLNVSSPLKELFHHTYLNQTYAKGYEFFIRGEYRQAEPYLTILYNQEPTFKNHTYYLAQSHLFLREFDKAAAILEHPQCPKTDPDWNLMRAEYYFAKRYFERCEEQARLILDQETASKHIRASAHKLLGALLARTERSNSGLRHLEKAVQLFKQANHHNGLISAIITKLNTMQYLGLEVELWEWQELVDLTKLLNNKMAQSIALNGLANNLYYAESWPEAYAAYEQNLKVRRELDDDLGQAISIMGMGSIATQMGQFESAESKIQQALGYFVEAGDTYNQVNSHLALALLYLAQRHLQKSSTEYQTAFNLSQEQRDTHGQILALMGLCEVALQDKNIERAKALLDQGEALGSTHERLRAGFKCYRAVIAYHSGSAQQAQSLMLEAKALLGASLWNDLKQTYLDIYTKALVQGTSSPLPYEENPLKGPDT